MMQAELFDRSSAPDVAALVRRGALFVVSHSGGKDSQAMMLKLAALVPVSQLVAIHAPLGRVEWPGTLEHIGATLPPGVELLLAPVANGRDLLDRVRARGKFPDPARRWCTSDLKRGPIEREIRRYLKAHPEHGGLVVSCMGHRAQESNRRAKRKPWAFSERNSKAGREWWEWLPIFALSEAEVFARIAAAGQRPHWAYERGMRRLSCSFCIMASKCDMTTAARLRPNLYRKYVCLERELGHTLSPSRVPLPKLTGVDPESLPRLQPEAKTS